MVVKQFATAEKKGPNKQRHVTRSPGRSMPSAVTLQMAAAQPQHLSPQDARHLQRTLGNRMTGRLLGRNVIQRDDDKKHEKAALDVFGSALPSPTHGAARTESAGGVRETIIRAITAVVNTQLGISDSDERRWQTGSAALSHTISAHVIAGAELGGPWLDFGIKEGPSVTLSGNMSVPDDRRFKPNVSLRFTWSASADISKLANLGGGVSFDRNLAGGVFDSVHAFARWLVNHIWIELLSLQKKLTSKDQKKREIEQKISRLIKETGAVAPVRTKGTGAEGFMGGGVGVLSAEAGMGDKETKFYKRDDQGRLLVARSFERSASLTLGLDFPQFGAGAKLTETEVRNHPNPDNDGLYVTYSLSLSAKGALLQTLVPFIVSGIQGYRMLSAKDPAEMGEIVQRHVVQALSNYLVAEGAVLFRWTQAAAISSFSILITSREPRNKTGRFSCSIYGSAKCRPSPEGYPGAWPRPAGARASGKRRSAVCTNI
jgi:hypothetical protein